MSYKTYIDVSFWQGEIDWEKVKPRIDGAILRAGYGQNNIDERFIRNITECNRLGIPVGVYWFSYAYTGDMAKREAEYCLAAIKPYKVELPVCFDFEYDSVAYAKKNGVTVTKELATSLVHAFCGAVEAAGYYAMNYTNPSYLATYFDATTLRYDLWLAQWPASPDPETPPRSDCGIWQYTGKGSVEGISGNVDLNAAYKDYPALIAKAGLNHPGETGEKAEDDEPWYAADQAWAVEQGITDGTRPDEPATRAEVWAMLRRAME